MNDNLDARARGSATRDVSEVATSFSDLGLVIVWDPETGAISSEIIKVWIDFANSIDIV